MERSSSQNHHLRPQIYVHFEFGVSWSPCRPPRKHEVTYRSRALRDRSQNFPRQLPAANTNYLATPSRHYSLHGHLPVRPHQQSLQPPQDPQSIQSHQHRRPREAAEPGRTSRGESLSSHERGRSAPPPLNSNPWDLYEPPTRAGPSATTQTHVHREPQLWKDLPEVPSRFRLGEEGMPWSAWSWPVGYDPDKCPEDDDEDDEKEEAAPSTRATRNQDADDRQDPGQRSEEAGVRPRSPAVASPAPPDLYPPERQQAVDSARARELEALSMAMVTVDNGFENQWWNQGLRSTTISAAAPAEPAATAPATATSPSTMRFSGRSLGWALASSTGGGARDERVSFATANTVVSPITEYSSPPPPIYQTLARSLSTRSEELWFTTPTDRACRTMPAGEDWSSGYYA